MNLQGVAHRGFSYTRGAYCYDAVDHPVLALRRRGVAVFGCWRSAALAAVKWLLSLEARQTLPLVPQKCEQLAAVAYDVYSCCPGTPCGRYARRAATRAGVAKTRHKTGFSG